MASSLVAASAGATAMATSPAAGEGSTVREAFRLMATLIFPDIPMAYLERCARILQRRHMETVFEERAVQALCAFPACGNKIRGKTAKYRVSLARQEIYDARQENQFCSSQCLKKARVYTSRLVNKPPQLVPSLLEVFGTETPNPFDEPTSSAATSAAVAASIRRTPRTKSAWAKNMDLGVVERPHPLAAAPRPQRQAEPSLVAPTVQEIASPAPPASEFPDATQAVLIEGLVFPAHKKEKAQRVEKKLQQKASKQVVNGQVASSSEEIDEVSGSGDESDDYDSDASSSTNDSALTSEGEDDDEDDDPEEMISSDDLPLFINLWRMLSDWITHDTTLLVAGKTPHSESSSTTRTGKNTTTGKNESEHEKKTRQDAERAAQQIFQERYGAFTLMLNRSIPQVARSLKLPCDRYATYRIDTWIKSFSFRDAIDGRQSDQWTCIASILLLVAHGKRVATLTDEQLSAVRKLTKLDTVELEQLLSLFYAVRDESEIVVDEDTGVKRVEAEQGSMLPDSTSHDQIKLCRKCRRTEVKCVCKTRAKSSASKDDFSSEELQQMFRDAVTLREHYDDLMDAAAITGGASVIPESNEYDALD